MKINHSKCEKYHDLDSWILAKINGDNCSDFFYKKDDYTVDRKDSECKYLPNKTYSYAETEYEVYTFIDGDFFLICNTNQHNAKHFRIYNLFISSNGEKEGRIEIGKFLDLKDISFKLLESFITLEQIKEFVYEFEYEFANFEYVESTYSWFNGKLTKLINVQNVANLILENKNDYSIEKFYKNVNHSLFDADKFETYLIFK